jgi:hypothetical protein
MRGVLSVGLLALSVHLGSTPLFAQPPAPAGNGSVLSAVAALEQRIAQLEARLNALETLDASDVPGTYRFALLGIEFNSGTPARVSSEGALARLRLDANGTGAVEDYSGNSCTLTQGVPWMAHCGTPQSGSGALTWTLAGNTVTITFEDNDTIDFDITISGVAVSAQATEFLAGNTWTNLALIVKESNP